MKSLDIIGENAAINQQAQDDYAKLFSQTLSKSHIGALAALFGWRIPENCSMNGGGCGLSPIVCFLWSFFCFGCLNGSQQYCILECERFELTFSARFGPNLG